MHKILASPVVRYDLLNLYRSRPRHMRPPDSVSISLGKRGLPPHLCERIFEYLRVGKAGVAWFLKEIFNGLPLNGDATCFGKALLLRFLDATGPTDAAHKNETRQRIAKESLHRNLQKHIAEVWWYRMGNISYYERWQCLIPTRGHFPPRPADILGRLSSGEWFYYKDAHPNYYGWGGQTHTKWVYLVASSLPKLMGAMDKEDIELFLKSETHWEPVSKRRCACKRCQQDRQFGAQGQSCAQLSYKAPIQKW